MGQVYLLKKVVRAALMHTFLIIISGAVTYAYFNQIENEEFQTIIQKTFLTNKAQLEQELYINSIIHETTDEKLSSVKAFKKALEASGHLTTIDISDGSSRCDYILEIPPKPTIKCLRVQIKNSVTEKSFKLVWPLLLVLFLTSLPIYYSLINSIKSESMLKLKAEIIDEMRHNINSPLLTLSNMVDRSIRPLNEDLATDFSNKIVLIRSYIQDVPSSEPENKLEIFNAHQIITEAVKDKKIELLSMSKSIEVHAKLESSKYLVAFNKMELASILSNLLNNSVNAITAKGEITVSSSELLDFLHITIVDNGRGILPEHIDKLFRKGATFNTKGGTGSGLYQAKYKLQALGGDIRISSEYTKGTTTTLIIPLSKSLNTSHPNTHNRCIHILEDDALLKHMYMNDIKENGLNKHFDIHFYSSPEKLLMGIKAAPITDFFVLDSQIGDDRTAGVKLSVILKEKGFINIFINSSYSSSNFSDLVHIKGIIKKDSKEGLILFLHGLANEINKN